MSLTPGTKLGHYEIRSKLGAGGMGDVYLAEDTKLKRKVALKLLSDDSTTSQQANRRFLREARAAATLDHPNICVIHEVGEEDGRAFIVMPYVEGETLDIKMKRKPLELPQALAYAVQIADALAEAHSHEIVHRDIKPSNIMITPRDQAKVMDFGLAKITTTGATEDDSPTKSLLTTPGLIIGTVPYMSPEQVRGEPVDPRSDIFSFGVLLYEMLTGRQPFGCDSAAATASAVLTRDPPPVLRFVPDASEEVQRIVRKCLEKDRERRYQTMRDVAIDLENVLVNVRQTRQSSQKTDLGIHETAESPTVIITRRDSSLRSPRISRPVLIVGALIVILTAGAIIYGLYLRRATVSSAAEIRSLAVLPLNNLSGDPAQEYFADGMTEALIAGLAKIGAIRVISRTSVMQYKGGHKSLPEIARELNVDAIVEGSVQRSGDRVRITTQLIRASTDQHLWAQTYDRNLSDVLALQSEVAGAIAREIQIKLTPQEQARLSTARAVNSEAYDYYLRGKFHSVRITETENQSAIEMYEHAVAIDPNFAMGFADLAQAYTRRLNTFAPEDKQWGEKAFQAVEKALALDPDLAEAHLARGLLLWTHNYHFPHERAAQEYLRAISLNPNLDEAHHQLGVVYHHIGLLDKALQEVQTAIAINPSNLIAQYRVGVVYLYLGRNEEALAVFSKYRDAPVPSFWIYQTAWARFNLGMRDEASKQLEESIRKDPEHVDGAISSMAAIVAAASGDNGRAESLIKSAQRNEKGYVHFHHIAYNIACAYALMNKVAPAVDWLEKAADDGLPCYPLFERDHNLDNLRQDPRFITFMAKQKEQWEYYKSTL